MKTIYNHKTKILIYYKINFLLKVIIIVKIINKYKSNNKCNNFNMIQKLINQWIIKIYKINNNILVKMDN